MNCFLKIHEFILINTQDEIGILDIQMLSYLYLMTPYYVM